MNITKNPHLKVRREINVMHGFMTLNAKHLCRLVYLLMNDPKAGFYKNRAHEFLDRYVEYVEYVQENNDPELRAYRFNKLMRDAPYITYSRADNILSCQEGFALDSEKPYYIGKVCRSDLVDNIVLALLVLHYEFGFGEKRIARYSTAWAHCGYAPAIEWVEKRLDVPINPCADSDVYDWLRATTPRKLRTTLQEQNAARRGLEEFRALTKEAEI